MDTDFLSGSNSAFVQELYEKYLDDPKSLDESWQYFFAGFEAGGGYIHKGAMVQSNDGLNLLVHSYRNLGHFSAKLDPLEFREPREDVLSLSQFGFTEADLEKNVGSGGFLGATDGTLNDLVRALKETYCGTIGVEYADLLKEQKEWLLERIEPKLNQLDLSKEESLKLLEKLSEAKEFENILQTKFLGQKRFSVEGAESLIPMLDEIVNKARAFGAEQMVFGMAHRGRLNVLAHILNKPVERIFREFEGKPIKIGDGDVKYHQGFSADRETDHGKIHVSLCPNPSHLEVVDPVVEGIVRAKQYYSEDTDHVKTVPILIHGEAAFTGQGIVFETLNLSQLSGYKTGGTIHIIINNQVGFTATASQTRFTPYPTDVAKMIQAPIFHVNADDPAACLWVARLAIEFRQTFKSDVMIDLWSYRKHGHNETDDPTFTQPVMYQKIVNHPVVTELYSEKLIETQKASAAEVEGVQAKVKEHLNTLFQNYKDTPKIPEESDDLGGLWSKMGHSKEKTATTKISKKEIADISRVCTTVPSDFNIHPKLAKLLELREEMSKGDKPIDWGCAEMWAFGSLLKKGIPVRLTGQDCERGTFSHRHAVLHDYQDGKLFVPLKQLAAKPEDFMVINSMLSELAVMGFEYGYSMVTPDQLVLWEAQFGDFVNGAQMILDQFISASESKWRKLSGLVLLLPHGYEGMGPEHSSGRLERFLQLCGDDNMQVCYPSVPHQYFHLLRRQLLRGFRKPLVLMMPKSLLRHEKSSSALSDFTDKNFETVIDDPKGSKDCDTLIFCSGKMYITLASEKAAKNISNVALIRIEELYPFPDQDLKAVVKKYPNAKNFIWAQEEPQNMGAWGYISPKIWSVLPTSSVLKYVGREEAASPAVGSHKMHEIEEKEIIAQAFSQREGRHGD